MASAEMIRVYVGERGKRGYFHPVIGRLPRDKVIRFSALAARIPAEHGSLIFPGYANISAVKRILRWIDENDAGSCRPLEAESDEFAESVILLSTGKRRPVQYASERAALWRLSGSSYCSLLP